METYTCECCGKVLEDWPSLTFKAPSYYWNLDEEKKQTHATLTNDFCTVRSDEDGATYYFIRVVMFQKVIDSCQDLHYGLWVSLSEASYNDYYDHYETEDYKEGYFGWLSSNIPEYDYYDSDSSIPTNVYTQKNGKRPYIEPHQSFDHPFVTDFYNGITKEEAEARIRRMIGE